MYDVSGKLLNGIKCMYVNSLACVRVKKGESECFKVCMDPMMKEVKIGMGKRGEISEGRERVETAWLLVCR